MFYCFMVTLACIAWRVIFRIKIIGKENLITDRGFVMCPNHISAIDPVFVVIARFWGKRMLIMGKEELFDISPIISWMFRHVGVIPVHRGKGDSGAVDIAIEKVKAGQGLLIFPEGTRTKDGKLGRLKSGAFVVADAAKADVIPCRIIYKGGKMRFFCKCTIVFGKPIPAESFSLGEPRSAARLRECKELLARELDDLLQANCRYL